MFLLNLEEELDSVNEQPLWRQHNHPADKAFFLGGMSDSL